MKVWRVDEERLEGASIHLEEVIEHLEGGSKSLEGWAIMHNLYLVLYLY